MLEKYPGERVVFFVNCTALLGSAEHITGTPTAEVLPKFTGGAALVIENPQYNAAQVTLSDGTIVAAGKLVSMTISAGQSSTDIDPRVYSVVTTFNTDAGNTLVAKSLLKVLPVGPA